MRGLVLLIVMALLAPAISARATWTHGWDSVGNMTFYHGGNKTQLLWVADAMIDAHYHIACFDNCYGVVGFDGFVPQEHMATASALKLRALSPSNRNLFYWKADMSEQIEQCSDPQTNATWMAHRDAWSFRDDSGRVLHHPSGFPYFDPTQAAFRQFWIGHLLPLASLKDNDGQPLFNGFFIDGCPQQTTVFANVSEARNAEYVKATTTMVGELQAALDVLGGDQLVMWNGLDTPFALANHASAAGGSMVDHFGIIQFVDKTTGEWLPAAMEQLLFEVVRSPRNAERTLEIKLWPGPMVAPMTWVNNTQPKTTAGLQAMLQREFNQALAVFLLVAEANHWLGYSWFWRASDFIPWGWPDHTCPDNFYPEFDCPLGPPKGPPAPAPGAPHVYTREFAFASVHVDLAVRANTRVTWHSSACAKLNRDYSGVI